MSTPRIIPALHGSNGRNRETVQVLLIEDSRADADFVMHCLAASRHEPFEAVHADRVASGIKNIPDFDPDVILLDLHLPDAHGHDTYKRVMEAAPEIPIVLMTSHEDEELARQAIRDGVQDYLLKRSIEPDLLQRAIRYAIERKTAALRLFQAEERYSLAVLGANDGIWDWDLQTSRIYLSTRWKQMLGYDDADLDSDPAAWFERIHDDDRVRVLEALEAYKGTESGHFEIEYLMVHRDGSLRWMLTRGIALRDRNGVVYRMAGSQTDITARKQAEIQLRHDAFHDSLTGLPNRALLDHHLSMAIAYSHRQPDYRFAVLLADLDRFKVVNDSLGHLAGDKLLIELTRRMQGLLRPGDLLARFGGDEFVFLMPDMGEPRLASRFAQRVQKELERVFDLNGTEIFATAAIGIVFGANGYQSSEEILRDLDIAMHRAKVRGRGNFEVYDHRMHSGAIGMLKMETDLRRAIEREEFIMHYQPIVSLDSRKLQGFEALVRWVHPERGLIHPDEFIPLAEESGLIASLGLWCMRTAVRQMADWTRGNPAMRNLTINVNLSSHNLLQPDLADLVSRLLRETRLDPKCLHLEITESVVMEHHDTVFRNLAALRETGISIHIDDFGTGYSSLSYLHRFPVNHIKIDRSFVRELNERGENLEIVRTITNLARILQMTVVAEGVETTHQLDQLRSLDIHTGQGFFFSRPLDSVQALEFLNAQTAS